MLSIQLSKQKITIEPIIFPSGEPQLNITNEIASYLACDTVIWEYQPKSDSVLELLQLKQLFKQNDIKQPTRLMIPYLPFARMDRIDEPTKCFSLEMIATIINDLNFQDVVLLDVHSPVALELIKSSRSVSIFTENYLKNTIKFNTETDVLVFPDKGAYTRYSSNYPSMKNIIIGNKVRDFQTGKITSIDAEIVQGAIQPNSNIYVIDDICSYGGTFIGIKTAIDRLNQPYKTANLIITHCEPAIHKGDVFNHYDHVYTTDSFYQQNEPTNQITIHKLFENNKWGI